jgi:hypothetical protein
VAGRNPVITALGWLLLVLGGLWTLLTGGCTLILSVVDPSEVPGMLPVVVPGALAALAGLLLIVRRSHKAD